MELIATCAFGLEKLVYDEIKSLGLWVIKKEDGRVTFKGDEKALIETNLWLRCADRVQIKIAEFQAQTFDELFDQTTTTDWSKYIAESDSFPIKATSVKSALHSEPAIQSIVKKAIVNNLQQKYNTQNLPENSGAVHQIVVKANKDQFIITIDTSGDSLHKRGYRTKANLAPIKETLAAAIIKLSDWTPERTLVDPFCGSGTFAIEAAQIAHNIAPGLTREFAFQKWSWITPETIKHTYEEARAKAKPIQKLPIYSFDIDPISLEIAEQNAQRAGFETLPFKRSDFKDLDFEKFQNCTFICNPPYGERLEDKPSVQEMYQKFGKKFTQTKNCSLFLISADETFPHLFGRPADKNRKLFNGKIRCYLFSFFSKSGITADS